MAFENRDEDWSTKENTEVHTRENLTVTHQSSIFAYSHQVLLFFFFFLNENQLFYYVYLQGGMIFNRISPEGLVYILKESS